MCAHRFGERVGYCADADFNLRTGKVNAFILTEGGLQRARRP
ncbi:MAG: PRC-barrel domain-containing protein [Collinsella intestinalis]